MELYASSPALSSLLSSPKSQKTLLYPAAAAARGSASAWKVDYLASVTYACRAGSAPSTLRALTGSQWQPVDAAAARLCSRLEQ